MTIIAELSKLRDARLKAEKSILKSEKVSADDLVEVEKLHDEIEELQELMLHYLYKKKAFD